MKWWRDVRMGPSGTPRRLFSGSDRWTRATPPRLVARFVGLALALLLAGLLASAAFGAPAPVRPARRALPVPVGQERWRDTFLRADSLLMRWRNA